MPPFIFNDMLRSTEQRARRNRCRGGFCPSIRTPPENDSLCLRIGDGSLPHPGIGNEGVPIESGYTPAVRTKPEDPPAILKNNGDNGRDEAVCNRVGLHLLRADSSHRCEQDETN